MDDLDFSKLLEDRTAVVCFDEYEQAKHFLDVVKRRCHKWFRSTRYPWGYGNRTAYVPNLPSGGTRMTYGNVDTYAEEGYNIIHYNELLVSKPDYGEIQCAFELSELF